MFISIDSSSGAARSVAAASTIRAAAAARLCRQMSGERAQRAETHFCGPLAWEMYS